jgi:hypothetical protein
MCADGHHTTIHTKNNKKKLYKNDKQKLSRPEMNEMMKNININMITPTYG